MPRRPPRLPPLLAEFDDDEREAVLAANRAFYKAFNDRDADAMERIWAPSGAMVCLHPGQAPLHERAEIMASWRGILRHPDAPRVRCSDEWTMGRGGLALVVCREILPTVQLMATNSFVRLSDGWHLVGHHSGPVPSVERPRTATAAPPAQPVRDRRKLH
ncbi:MAG: nuclear transport factor 2 family protein [Enhydrobacter sp.]|nr:MAG: nuclear transport factor 2 family protein [Enhydrobacter sp.]